MTDTEMSDEERRQAKEEYEAAVRAFNEARDALDEAWRIGDMSPSPEAWKALAALDEPRARLLAARDRYYSDAGLVPATQPAG